MKLENAKTRDISSDLEPKDKLQKRVSLLQEKFREEITYLGIDQLVAYRHQARDIFDDESLVSLSQTIKLHGIRQPLTVLARPDDKYEIVSGERRYRAAIMAGLTRVPCMIMQDGKQAEEIALIENVQRTDLTLLELGRALAGLMRREIFLNQSEMADQLGLPRTKVVECINLARLREDVQSAINKNDISSRELLREIVALKDADKQIDFISKHITNTLQDRHKPKLVESVKGSNSIVRISLHNYGFNVQKKGLSRMSPEHKKELKTLLTDLISEL